MELPISAYFLVPVFAVLSIIFRRNLLALAVASSVVQAASILDINLGGSTFGIPVWIPLLITSLVVRVATTTRRTKPRHPRYGEAKNRGAMVSMTVFFAYCFTSAFIMPYVFEGIPFTSVLSNRQDGNSVVHFASTNITQAAYLLIGAATFYTVAFESNRSTKERIVEYFTNASVVAALIGIYQVVSEYRGWYFPGELLHSNSAFSQLGEDDVAGLYRLTATFSEASIAALFLSGAFGVTLVKCCGLKPKVLDCIKCVLLLVSLVLTFSTTAYVCLSIGALYFIAVISRRALRSRKAVRVGVLVLTVTFGCTAMILSDSSLRAAAETILTNQLSDKTDSLSYIERSKANDAAMSLFKDTYFLGAGYGTCRASSAIFELLGNSGIIAVTALISGLISLLLRRNKISSINFDSHLVGFGLMLIAQVIAVPDLVFPALWAFWGLLVGSGRTKKTLTFPINPRKVDRNTPILSGSQWESKVPNVGVRLGASK